MVRFYRDLIDTYLASSKGAGTSPFDLSPWQSRLAAIQAQRDTARSDGTRLLLIEARQPVPAN
jgi:hypothetical protein